jgi:hypothetical protein
MLVSDTGQVKEHVDTLEKVTIEFVLRQVQTMGRCAVRQRRPGATAGNHRVTPGGESLAKLATDKSCGATDEAFHAIKSLSLSLSNRSASVSCT